MSKSSREIGRYTSEDTARMQAIWAGMMLAAAVFVASFLYFRGTQTDMASNTPPAVPHTSGSSSPSR